MLYYKEGNQEAVGEGVSPYSTWNSQCWLEAKGRKLNTGRGNASENVQSDAGLGSQKVWAMYLTQSPDGSGGQLTKHV